MRIIAGAAKGRLIAGPKGLAVRPTSDRVRETLFNVLGQWMEGWRVLDLFAGTGALALEALSRGASRAVMVEARAGAVRLCRDNAAALGYLDRVEILGMPAERAVEKLGRADQQFEVVFADPPYRLRAVPAVLGWLDAHGLLAPQGVACIEHDKREKAPDLAHSLSKVDERRFGDTQVSLYRTS